MMNAMNTQNQLNSIFKSGMRTAKLSIMKRNPSLARNPFAFSNVEYRQAWAAGFNRMVEILAQQGHNVDVE